MGRFGKHPNSKRSARLKALNEAASSNLAASRQRLHQAYKQWRIEAYKINPDFVTPDPPPLESDQEKIKRRKRWAWLRRKKYLYKKGYQVQLPYWMGRRSQTSR